MNDLSRISTVDLIEALAVHEARASFWAYRQYLDPNLKIGWWQREIARELQRFAERLRLGEKPKLVIQAPPQHGKSVQIIEFISWLAGHQPHLKSIYASFSERLGIRANLRLQRIYDSRKYKLAFPGTSINQSNVVTVSGQYLRNREILEYVGHTGGFRNTTVRGAVTGEGLDLGIIDDPIKGREEASSSTIRDKTWDWFTDDFFTRFSEDAGFLAIMTRWHVDDPIGRMIDHFGEDAIRVLRYPAIAEESEPHRKAGEPLFPNHKSLEFLLERKALMTMGNWEALYQQNPIIIGGGMFPIDRFVIDSHRPAMSEISASVRYWDKAGTEDGGAYSAGVLMHKMRNGTFVVSDVDRGQWSYSNREKKILECAKLDKASYPMVKTWVEQEPGSGGKESAERTIAMLAGYPAYADKVTGDKETRADPYSAQVQNGHVHLVAGDWVKLFKGEHETFPNGKYKDQVDAAAAAFMKLTGGSSYTLDNVR